MITFMLWDRKARKIWEGGKDEGRISWFTYLGIGMGIGGFARGG